MASASAFPVAGRGAIHLPPNPAAFPAGTKLKQEMVWLYFPWQQMGGPGEGEKVPHYLLFTVAQMPPLDPFRFDAARWDRSNYGR